MRERVFEEFDYVREAANQRAFCDLYDGHPYIRIPRIIDSHSTGRVLTSEYVAGRCFDEIVDDDEEARSRWGEILYRFAIGSIMRFGVFNGDPHPGNYIFDDRGRVVFLDFGCLKYFPETMLRKWWNLIDSHLSGNPDRFRELAIGLDFITPETDIDRDLLYDYFSYYYEPFHDDREYTFTREYNSQALLRVLRPMGRFAGMEKKMNMPRDFVLVNRIHWGVFSLLAQLEATGNWHRIHGEYLYGRAPQTELGTIDREHHERWLEQRDFEREARILLRPDGIRRREPQERASA
jgi:predicted unusual protein kinase regulating ubiquinone biosynthesis (AarF/ABC1/UbiB family)